MPLIQIRTLDQDASVARTEPKAGGFTIRHYFTAPEVHPFDEIVWEKRQAVIAGQDGQVFFEQSDVEAPVFWSQMATNVVVSKYFRGKIGTPERETSVKQMVRRVADTIAEWGRLGGYFSDEEAAIFNAELTHLLVNQKAAFNSPVWFNVGVREKPQCSACFILSVDDNMESILDWIKKEGIIFKHGSGSGVNLSTLRSSRERLSLGGTASGPVSFMRGADASAGAIKSGGTTRRAAKMVILNIDHPDIVEFIRAKELEEKKAWALGSMGYDMSLNGEAWQSIQFQNANNSVRVTDEFMRAYENDKEWHTRNITTGKPVENYRARDLMKMIAEAAWVCGDPGMQFDTTINDWHTCPNAGRINASNPCFSGDALVYTDKGLVPFADLYDRTHRGESFSVFTHDRTSREISTDSVSLTSPTQVMMTGLNDIYRLRFSNGVEVKATKNHRFFTVNRGMVSAAELKAEDAVLLLDQAVTLPQASTSLAVDEAMLFAAGWGGRRTKEHKPMIVPRVWTTPLAEYVGFLVGDGCVREAADATHRLSTATVVFGSAAEAEQLMPRFEPMLVAAGIAPQRVVMSNGTVQLRANRTPFVRFLKQLGVKEEKAPAKRVPRSLFEAPHHVVAGFLRGLFTADGCVYGGSKHRYVGLGSRSQALLQEVQQQLLTFGIHSRIYESSGTSGSFAYTTVDGDERHYQSTGPAYDLRISGPAINRFRDTIGFLIEEKQHKLDVLLSNHQFYRTSETVSLKSCEYIGKALTYNLTEPKNHSYIVNGLVVANCSEYMHVDNSACNLASLNLMKFIDKDGELDVESFIEAVNIMILAQEIIVGFSSYPTPEITKNALDYRELGLGYANLGALLMSKSLPYDSDEGRAYAAAITALMTGAAYGMSAKIAARLGPFAGYAKNREPMLGVILKHRAALKSINADYVPTDLMESAIASWEESLALGEQFGYRNSQTTLLAPTGTIAFLMDCDTTGVEPDIALIKYKTLVGGGLMKIVNNTVPAALRNLDYSKDEIKEIMAHIDEHETVEGAPHLKAEHLPVFDCAFKPVNGHRSIHYMGHLKMMGAVQPFLSGAISKTVNMDNSATPGEIVEAYYQAWKLGIKALAIYRDGSKRTQPLVTSVKKSPAEIPETMEVETDIEVMAKAVSQQPSRHRLPDERQAVTHKFTVGGHEGYITVGLYDDGKPGEIFVTMSKEGSTISGLMDAFATSISIGLQHGMPLKDVVRKFTHMRFEPSGFTKNPTIPIAKSIIDYIFQWLGRKFLSVSEQMEIGLISAETAAAMAEPSALALPDTKAVPVAEDVAGQIVIKEHITEKFAFRTQTDAPTCADCGSLMVRNASCYKCWNCGSTSGCS